ncbi:MAG TPA: di-heme oxidoredictase family protein [Gemmatimonadales bacterium]|nr:di-heme oxidoredictase family protein [Gemmatimonadales bacterium]
MPADLTTNMALATAAAALGSPLSGLTAAERARFAAGVTEFSDAEGVDDGLGPVFNEASCSTCHTAPLGGTAGRAETRFGRVSSGLFDPLANLGGSLMQDHAIGLVHTSAGDFTFVPEMVPPSANVVALRITTPLFGLGLVDAVPDDELLQLARREARSAPSTQGTPSMTTEIKTGATRVGRFGWKAQNPTLHQFAGDAYLNEMGITNPEFPTENCPQGNCASLAFNPAPAVNDTGDGVTAFTDFMSMLGPPRRGAITRTTIAGGAVFVGIGCANCHTPILTTGDSPIAALSHKAFQPFSDFLLHDMGSLGDGITQGNATGRLMRTAPLWGLSSRPVFLHDGRASTPAAAILAHAGQGQRARDRYAALRPGEQAALLAFLKSL